MSPILFFLFFIILIFGMTAFFFFRSRRPPPEQIAGYPDVPDAPGRLASSVFPREKSEDVSSAEDQVDQKDVSEDILSPDSEEDILSPDSEEDILSPDSEEVVQAAEAILAAEAETAGESSLTKQDESSDQPPDDVLDGPSSGVALLDSRAESEIGFGPDIALEAGIDDAGIDASIDKEVAESVGNLVAEAEAALEAAQAARQDESAIGLPVKPSFRERLTRTRKALTEHFSDIRLRRKIDDEVWEDLEEALILADLGADMALDLVETARQRAATEKAETPTEVLDALKEVMIERLAGKDVDRSLSSNPDTTLWVMVGVNGTGKTTTVGKLAKSESVQGRKCVLAAADTFRAAAAEQLEVWAARSRAELVRGQEGADPGAVVFDALSFATAKKMDLLLIDTAGRLHTKTNLMEELRKIFRVIEKAGATPDEVLLVLDATTGQNGLIQAREFARAASITGVVLTKLDGTAKGGIAFAIEQEFDIPIKLVGLGEGEDDLVVFDAKEFVEALFE